MKRRITTDQLQQLTAEQQQRLREWWKPERGDYVLVDKESWCIYDMGCVGIRLIFDEVNWMYECREESTKEQCLPLLDIGQMIELIMTKQKCLDIEIFQATNVPNKENYIAHVSEVLRSVNPYPIYQNRELCDALFEAVKQIL